MTSRFLTAPLLGAVVLAGMGTREAAALDRRVQLVNNCRYTVMKFQASNRDSNSWEEDILGVRILSPGEAVIMNIDDGTGYCVYDFRATFEDGDVAEQRGINVCKVSTFTIND